MRRSPHPYRSALRTLPTLAFLGVLLSATPPALAQGAPRILFLHHSTGHNLIEEGSVREGLGARGYQFFDHGYNGDGLRLADGSYTGTNFDVPGDNTDPDGLAAIFSQPFQQPAANTFSRMLEYDVILVKSCFPVSNIASEEQLREDQNFYLTMRERMDQHPDKLFIILTQPPQVPGASDAAEAARARRLADWLDSDDFLGGHPNVRVFDFFDLLAGSDGFLRSAYRYDDYDAHPNARANRDIGPVFVDFIDQAVRSFEPGAAVLAPAPSPAPAETPTAVAATPAAPGLPVAGIVESFEAGADMWHADTGSPGSTVHCAADGSRAQEGQGSLRFEYHIGDQDWVDCGFFYDQARDWSAGSGLSLWLQAETVGEEVTLMVFSGPMGNPTPFEVNFTTPSGCDAHWTELSFAWSEFEVAPWANQGGLEALDPSRITGYGFSIGAWEGAKDASLWLDSIGLRGR